jgi:hypothetical protein
MQSNSNWIAGKEEIVHAKAQRKQKRKALSLRENFKKYGAPNGGRQPGRRNKA